MSILTKIFGDKPKSKGEITYSFQPILKAVIKRTTNQFVNITDTDTGKQVNFIDGRYYTKDEKNWYPGATTILNAISKGEFFENWLKSNGFNADVLSRQAMDQGSRVHEAIETLLKCIEVHYVEGNYSRNEWMMISRFIDFYLNFKPKTIAIEAVLVSDKLHYGGQLDYICELGGDLWLIDHKTGNIYDNASMQLSAYVQLWNEYYPKTPIKKVGILHLEAQTRGRDKQNKTIQGSGWKLIEITDIENQFNDFQHVHAVWERLNPNYKPFNLSYPESYKLNEH